MRRLLALVAVLAATALSMTKAYDVDVYRNCLGTVTQGDVGVGQYFRMCVDSLCTASLWVGDKTNGAPYSVQVRDSATNDLVAETSGVVPLQSWSWLNMPLAKRANTVKGRTYKVVFTRPAVQPIEFAYAPDPYKYGGIILPQGDNQSIPLTYDLACRVEGVMDTISREDFGAFCFLPIWDDSNPQACRLKGDTWVMRAQEAGIGWGALEARWHLLQPSKDGPCLFNTFDDYIWRLTRYPNILHAKPAVVLMTSPTWASSRDTLVRRPDGQGGWIWYRDTAVACAPRNLWDPDSNYWSMFLGTMLGHTDQDPGREAWQPCDSIHTWIIGNESNDTCVIDTMYYRNVTGWWRRPNRQYLGAEFAGLRGLCSLYVRMGYIAAESIRSRNGHDTDRVLIGNTHRAVARNAEYLAGGVDWLRTCYEIALKDPGYIYWDGVAFHPYQEEHDGFSPDRFEADLDSIRAVMRDFGDADAEVWNTEMGWNTIPSGHTEEQDARNVCEVLTAAKASEARPEGGYARTCWWVFYRPQPTWQCWGLLDSNLTRQDPFYAFKQTQEQLVGKRCNGRVMLGDARDDSCRIYEFENPADSHRTWVAWRNDTLGTGDEPPPVAATLPVRADENDWTLLAYQSGGTSSQKSAGQGGWLQETLTTRPVFVTESTAVNRPDLATDSVRFEAPPRIGEPATLRAWVRNTGRQTPDVRLACTFYGNGESLGVATRTEPIGHNATAVFTLSLARVPESLRGAALFSATVNPRQSIVEASGLDHNTAYLKTLVQ